jgi:hypothetical protein
MDATAASDIDRNTAAAGALRLSVIVPLAPGETAWRGLVDELAAVLPDDAELILVHADASSPLPAPVPPPGPPLFRQLNSAPSRARQQNAGAHTARGRWFAALRRRRRWAGRRVARSIPAGDPRRSARVHRSHPAR